MHGRVFHNVFGGSKACSFSITGYPKLKIWPRRSCYFDECRKNWWTWNELLWSSMEITDDFFKLSCKKLWPLWKNVGLSTTSIKKISNYFDLYDSISILKFKIRLMSPNRQLTTMLWEVDWYIRIGIFKIIVYNRASQIANYLPNLTLPNDPPRAPQPCRLLLPSP